MKKKFKIRFQKFSRPVITFLFIVLSFASVEAERHERKIESWQPLHFDIKISFDENLSRLDSATTDITILIRQNDVTKIDFDFGTMPVSAVKVDNEPAKFAQTGEKLDVYFTKPRKEKSENKYFCDIFRRSRKTA